MSGGGLEFAMPTLQVNMIGGFSLARNGKEIPLPNSKKTRALLSYLIVTGRPQRRERLCELFWDLVDDPRGALRWSLSKLRPIINESEVERLVSDRERVSFVPHNVTSDVETTLGYLQDENASADMLTKGLSMLREGFLPGTDLPDQEFYTNWLMGERERIDRIREKAVERLIKHPETPPDLGVTYAEQWLELRPYSPRAADAVLNAHRKLGQKREYSSLLQELKSRFADAGIDWTPQSDAPSSVPEPSGPEKDRQLLTEQVIQFCKTRDDVTIAYASVGSGPPLVKAANWLTHLELDWNAPIWSPLFRELANDFNFIRYDERGNGLSDWDVADISQDTFVTDLETVADTLKLEQFPLLGISQGAAVSIDYAIRHPQRVSKLIVFGGYPKGWRVDATPEIIAEREAVMTLTKTGWGRDNPAYRHIFSATFMPGATPDQLAWFDGFQRQTTSPENAVRFLKAFADIDVRDKLAKLTVPTLVIHSRGDKRIPWETGRDIAAAIPNAQFVTLESDNHLLLEGEPAAKTFTDAIRSFLLD